MMGTVLIISRDPAVSHAVCTFLSQTWIAASCQPGREAESFVAQACVDVIIVDVKTPEAEELRFIRTLKKRFPQIPVIFLSLYATQLSHSGDRELFRDAIFFSKPFDNEAVAAAVALLGTARRRPEGLNGRPVSGPDQGR